MAGKCAACSKAKWQQQDERRGTPAERGYDAAWRRLRQYVLSTEPLCRACDKQGRLTAAREVDHITRISDGGGRLDIDNLQPLCKPCHSAKTMSENNRVG